MKVILHYYESIIHFKFIIARFFRINAEQNKKLFELDYKVYIIIE